MQIDEFCYIYIFRQRKFTHKIFSIISENFHMLLLIKHHSHSQFRFLPSCISLAYFLILYKVNHIVNTFYLLLKIVFMIHPCCWIIISSFFFIAKCILLYDYNSTYPFSGFIGFGMFSIFSHYERLPINVFVKSCGVYIGLHFSLVKYALRDC